MSTRRAFKLVLPIALCLCLDACWLKAEKPFGDPTQLDLRSLAGTWWMDHEHRLDITILPDGTLHIDAVIERADAAPGEKETLRADIRSLGRDAEQGEVAFIEVKEDEGYAVCPLEEPVGTTMTLRCLYDDNALKQAMADGHVTAVLPARKYDPIALTPDPQPHLTYALLMKMATSEPLTLARERPAPDPAKTTQEAPQ